MEQRKDVGSVFDLAARRMEVAREDLDTAKDNLQGEHYRAANNRAYYSIYHSITAVFALESRAYKKHKDTLANFNKDYVKTEIFSRELGKRIGKSNSRFTTKTAENAPETCFLGFFMPIFKLN